MMEVKILKCERVNMCDEWMTAALPICGNNHNLFYNNLELDFYETDMKQWMILFFFFIT
jgi:hypothetical protein